MQSHSKKVPNVQHLWLGESLLRCFKTYRCRAFLYAVSPHRGAKGPQVDLAAPRKAALILCPCVKVPRWPRIGMGVALRGQELVCLL